MTRLTLQQQLEEAERKATYWQAKYNEYLKRDGDQIEELGRDLANAMNLARQAEDKFNEVASLWNQWVEADKGLLSPDKEATVKFPTDVFQKLLSLLRP